ncbi:MAG: tetratricopeptide repeat protein, partial [Anaerolineae bacterium]|nr:tetratricopeptide repeat protein [Anaerolineae bacterium]
MKRRAFFMLSLLIIVSTLAAPLLALAQEDEELVCDAFPTSATDVRTGYYMGEGTGYFAAGQLTLAIDSFSCVAEQIDPGYVPAFMNRAAAYAQRRLYDEAIADYTRAIELDSSLKQAYNNRGIIYAALREYELAQADFSQAIALDGNYILAYNNRAVIHAILGEYDQAIATLEQAIDLSGIDDVLADLRDPERPADAPYPSYDPDHAQAYALLGMVYSARALANYHAYLTLRGSRSDARIQNAAGALESR